MMKMGNNLSDKKQRTDELLTAVAEGDLRLVRKALINGARLNGHDDVTPLGIAIEKKNTMLARFLINQGADVTKPHKGLKPLIHAIYTKDEDLVERLVVRGADVNETFGMRASWNPAQILIKTPLILSIEEGAYDVAKVLIHQGADPLKFIWQNENAFITVQDYNRGDKWMRLLKSNIKRPITRQHVEAAKQIINQIRQSRENGTSN